MRALEPRDSPKAFVSELQAEIDRVHTTNSAEFTLARWLSANRDSLQRRGSILELELAVWHHTARLVPMPDAREAAKLGITGTPAFLVNGRYLSGAQPYEAFKRLIDEELKRG